MTTQQRLSDGIVILLFVGLFLVAYRDFVTQQDLLWILNLPPPSANAEFYLPGQFYWYPGNIGSPALPSLTNWFVYSIVLLSGRNLPLAEKLLASSSLLSCVTMYVFLSAHFSRSRLANFAASVIFGLGPSTALDFADFQLWGYAALPLVFHFAFNILEGKRRPRDILLLGLSLSVLTSFLPQVLSLVVMTLFVLLALRALVNENRSVYLKRQMVCYASSFIILLFTSPNLVHGALQLLAALGYLQSGQFVVAQLPQIYSWTYANQGIANAIRLIGGAPNNHLPEDNVYGFVLPLVAFSSLLLTRERRKLVDILALSIISLIVVCIIFGIHNQSDWAMWLVQHTPAQLFFFPERPLYLVVFAYAVMTCVTVDAIQRISVSLRSTSNKILCSIVLGNNTRKILYVSFILVLLSSIFLFAPTFNVDAHRERYRPLPPIYPRIESWLSVHDAGSYRLLFLPTDSFVSILGVTNVFQYTPGYGLQPTADYIDLTYNAFVAHTHNLGSLLAPATVKYVILATPNPASLWRGTLPGGTPLDPILDLSGPLRYADGRLRGDPSMISRILDSQVDLKLEYSGADFRVYRNLVTLDRITAFSSAVYIVGSDKALSVLPDLQGYSVQRELPILASQNLGNVEELMSVSSTLLFFDTDVNAIQPLMSQHDSMRGALISKNQLYILPNSSTSFSRTVTLTRGNWSIAVQVPKVVTVTPDMSIMDLDEGETFTVAKENFKHVGSSTLAFYYFYTEAGGKLTVSVVGSGALSAYVASNVTSTSQGIEEKLIRLPSSGTFGVDLPPNSTFRPIIQDSQSNISEIVVSLGGKDARVRLDGEMLKVSESTDAWITYGPMMLISGVHKISVENSTSGGLIVVFNAPSMDSIFNTRAGMAVFDGGGTHYQIHNLRDPSFLLLSESYSPGWLAYSGNKELVHFLAFGFLNGYYVDSNANGLITITYRPPIVSYVYVGQEFLFVAVGIGIVIWYISRRIAIIWK